MPANGSVPSQSHKHVPHSARHVTGRRVRQVGATTPAMSRAGVLDRLAPLHFLLSCLPHCLTRCQVASNGVIEAPVLARQVAPRSLTPLLCRRVVKPVSTTLWNARPTAHACKSWSSWSGLLRERWHNYPHRDPRPSEGHHYPVAPVLDCSSKKIAGDYRRLATGNKKFQVSSARKEDAALFGSGYEANRAASSFPCLFLRSIIVGIPAIGWQGDLLGL
jgi:hypothetical protein